MKDRGGRRYAPGVGGWQGGAERVGKVLKLPLTGVMEKVEERDEEEKWEADVSEGEEEGVEMRGERKRVREMSESEIEENSEGEGVEGGGDGGESQGGGEVEEEGKEREGWMSPTGLLETQIMSLNRDKEDLEERIWKQTQLLHAYREIFFMM